MTAMSNFMVRAERVERLLRVLREGDDEVDVIEILQPLAAGMTSSEVNLVSRGARGFIDFDPSDLTDNVKDDVALGIEIALKLKSGETIFSATMEDLDGRAIHFFFIAQSEDELFERVRSALEGDRS